MTTIYVLNDAGLDEIRADLERFSKHAPTDEAVHAYAADAEQSMNNSLGENGGWEIRGLHSKTGNPVINYVSADGWDVRQSDI